LPTLTHHDDKAEKHDRGDLAAEPEHFAVGNEDDGQVLEDGIDRNAQELETIFRGTGKIVSVAQLRRNILFHVGKPHLAKGLSSGCYLLLPV